MFNRLKERYVIITMLLILPLLLPFAQQVDAYGIINHENVVDAGKNHFIILKEDGSVWSWGNNTYGQLGAKRTEDSANPLPILKEDGNRLSNIVAVAAGGNHSVALDSSGKVWTWGYNYNGQLGHSPANTKNANPTIVMNLPKIVAIAAGDQHTLAVDERGIVWSWGRNAYGQLGYTTSGISAITPKAIATSNGFSDIVAIEAGAEHSVALKRDGTVFAWGRNTVGQLGNGETTDVNTTPVKVPGLVDIMEIAAGDNHTLALKQDRTTVWAWGSNSSGQLGDGGREMKLQPVQVQGIQNIKAIAAGDNHTIAIKEDGSVWTWGRNTSGSGSYRTTPIQIIGLNNAMAIGGGGETDSFTLAVAADGSVWKWNKTSSDSTTKLPIFQKVSGIDDVMKLDEFPFVQGNQVLFRYIGNSGTGDVKVNGSFNDNIDLPMIKKSGNVWELQIELQPGEFHYGFKVNGVWTVDPLNRDKMIDDFGRTFSVLKVAPYASVGPIIDNKEVTFTYSSFDAINWLELDAKTASVSVAGNFGENYHWIEIPLIKQKNNIWKLTRTLAPGDYYYSFFVRDALTGAVPEKRNDPLNTGLQTDSLTGISRNTFTVSEEVLTKIPVSGITLNKGPLLDLMVGEQEIVAARISPSNATNKNVKWVSSNSTVVSVDAGKLTAHSKGTAVITASAVDGGEMATVTVTVHQQPNAISFPRVGYKEFKAKTGVAPTKIWYVKFGKEPNMESIEGNVYIRDESGADFPVGYRLGSDKRTLEIHPLNNFTYKRGATYYLFIEPTVKAMYTNENIKEPVQMKFQIAL